MAMSSNRLRLAIQGAIDTPSVAASISDALVALASQKPAGEGPAGTENLQVLIDEIVAALAKAVAAEVIHELRTHAVASGDVVVSSPSPGAGTFLGGLA